MADIQAVTTSFTNLTNGIRVFSRTAGPVDGASILLLHGFPSSSNQFRNLIPILAGQGYRVTAPDYPGFGFTDVPSNLNFHYTFANLTETIADFLNVIGMVSFAVYIFDYGAPVGLRLALQRPEAIQAIISQNGNAYEGGLLPFWDPLKQLWAAPTGTPQEQNLRQQISNSILNYNATRGQYVGGEPHPESIDPASWTLDAALLDRPAQQDIQLDLFKDYATNVVLYPQFQEYFRKSQVPLLAVWGKNDVIFGHPEAFKKDLPNAEVEKWNGGHFLVESHTKEMGEKIVEFLRGIGY